MLLLTAVFTPLLAVRSSAQSAVAAGSLSGTVFSDSGDVPIANAEISFPNLQLSARSDRNGNFQIAGGPAGPQELVVRLVGYEPFTATIRFRVAQKVEADFMLKPIVTKLAKISVKAAVDTRYAIRLADFEERRRLGAGRFITSDVFEKAEGQNMSQLLISTIPGIRTVGKSSKQVLVSLRSKTCALQVIINGMVQFNGHSGQEEFDINNVYTGQVIGLEYYTVATTPPQFNGTSGAGDPGKLSGGSHCGTVVIWTK